MKMFMSHMALILPIKRLESENVWEVLDIKKHDYMVKKNVKGIYCLVKVT